MIWIYVHVYIYITIMIANATKCTWRSIMVIWRGFMVLRGTIYGSMVWKNQWIQRLLSCKSDSTAADHSQMADIWFTINSAWDLESMHLNPCRTSQKHNGHPWFQGSPCNAAWSVSTPPSLPALGAEPPYSCRRWNAWPCHLADGFPKETHGVFRVFLLTFMIGYPNERCISSGVRYHVFVSMYVKVTMSLFFCQVHW